MRTMNSLATILRRAVPPKRLTAKLIDAELKRLGDDAQLLTLIS
jgi:hypothetical protein